MRISVSRVLMSMVWVCVALVALGGWGVQAAAANGQSRGLMGRAKQPRATRGFKNSEMMTARGFGKRGLGHGSYMPGSSDAFMDGLEPTLDRNFIDQLDDKLPESVPVDWFVDELLNNPELTRTMVRKFMDTNQDGVLSVDELLRNTY